MAIKTITIVISAQEVLYVGQQIFRDLREIKKAYSDIIDSDRIMKISEAVMTFLINNAVEKIGFSICDPAKENLVYHEWIYVVLQGDALPESMKGTQQGKGGEPIVPVSKFPQSIKFKPWVIWSNDFLQLSDDEQKLVIEGTGWELPGTNKFERKHKDSTGWSHDGYYVSGQMGVEIQTYRDDS